MHLLDNFVKNKFLYNISLLINQYQISPELSPFGRLLQFLGTSEHFSEEIFTIYTEYYQRHFIILELLASKQDLEVERQVFQIVRESINKTNTKLTISHLLNLYYSHTNRQIVYTPERIAQSGIKITL